VKARAISDKLSFEFDNQAPDVDVLRSLWTTLNEKLIAIEDALDT
jgi:hypothetical protein